MLSRVDLHDEGAATATLQWSAVCGDLLRGLTHTLSNRIELLNMLSTQLATDTSDIEAAVVMLRDECSTFTTLLHLLRLLPYHSFHGTAPPEPLSLTECVGEAVALLRHNRIGHEAELVVTGERGLPAIWAHRMELRRTLITLLFAALRDVRKHHEALRKLGVAGTTGETIELTCRADSRAVTLEIRAPQENTESQRAFWPTAAYFARAAGAELRSAGGELEAPRDGTGVPGEREWRGPIELRIPTLEAVRAASEPVRL